MQTQSYQLAGDTVQIRFVESAADADEAVRWCQSQRLLAFDSETPHLLHFAADFRVRLAQFGNSRVAYVLPVERDAWSRAAASRILTEHRRMLGFNVPFDALAAGVDGLVGDAVELQTRMVDVGLISRLEDPRSKGQPGAAGHKLKELCDVYVDSASPDTQEGLAEFFASQGWGIKDSQKKPLGWGLVDLTEPIYWLYAGLDVILLSLLFPLLYEALKPSPSYSLLNFERQVQAEVMRPERKGMKLDVPYAEQIREEFKAEEAEYSGTVTRYGIKTANSSDQVAAALLAMGEDIPERTDGGKVQVDKNVLARLADVNVKDWGEQLGTREPNPLALAVMYTKRSQHWQGYVNKMLGGLDANGRVHAKFNSLQARTARMSVSGIPVQQWPASDPRLRKCVIAEDGHVLVASDYAAVELRLLAALADIPAMKDAIANGRDLHNTTGSMIYGDDFADKIAQGDPWAKRQRGILKVVAFGSVYGGGPTAVSRQTGLSFAEAADVQKLFFKVYPEIRRYSRELQHEATLNGFIVTPTGRKLPTDTGKAYAALNYACQSVARDVFADSLLRLRDEGMTGEIILLVHDEIVSEVREDLAADYAKRLGELMTTEVLDVPIAADGEILGRHWRKGS